MPMRYRHDDPATPFGIAVGLGAAGMVVAGIVAAAIPATYPGWRFGVIAVAVFAFAAATLDQWALAATAAIGFLIANGFLEDRLGQLAWHGSVDLWHLLLLVIAGACGLAVGEGYRYVRDRRSRRNTAGGVALPVSFLEEETHGA
jgi:hypothetical protein